MWANHTMEKMDEYIMMCTQLKVSSPGGVRGEDTQVALHQSNGIGHDVDQSQHVVLMHVQSNAHQATQQTQKKGETIFTISKSFKRRGGLAKSSVLDFSPEVARPGGHSGKGVPIRSRFDKEHSRRTEFADQNLQNRFADLGLVRNFV